MRIKKAAEAKHEASRTPSTSDFVKKAADASLLQLLRSLQSFQKPWGEPRGDLYHWIPLLNTFDHVLEEFNNHYKLTQGPQTRALGRELLVEGLQSDTKDRIKGSPEQDIREGEDDERLICTVLDFTRYLMDNCANKSLYNSSEALSYLLNSTSLEIIVCTLHLGSRLALTYLRSWSNRQSGRNSLNSAVLTSHYRIEVDKVQKLAEPFAANLQKTPDGGASRPQTPSVKGKEVATPAKKTAKQSPKIHPNDLLAFVKEPQASEGDFSEFAVICFDTDQGLPKTAEASATESHDANSIQTPNTPTPARRVSGPSRLSWSTALDDTGNSDVPTGEGSPSYHKLVIQPQVVQSTNIHELLATYLPKIPKTLHYAFLVRLRFAKALCGSADSRRLAVAARILALANISLLYPESMLQQRIMQQDLTEPKQLQIVYQLAELSKPPGDKSQAVPQAIVEYTIEALDALARAHKTRHSDIIAALGINVNHGTLFQILRSIVEELADGSVIPPRTLHIHETVFGMLDSLLTRQENSRPSSRTVESLVSTGLFGVLVEILNIHSNKAQPTQNRVLQFVSEGMHVVRDGIRAFANAGGLDAVSELVAWEVNTCIEAVSNGQGLSVDVKSRLMDYEAPFWNQQTLRTTLKLINHMLGHSSPTNDRLLRNLIDTPALLKAVNEILKNPKLFGSNNYSQAVMLVSTFINNEPTSYAVIAEAGLSKSLLESISGTFDESSQPSDRRLPLPPSKRGLPIQRVPGKDEVICGPKSDRESISIARSKDAQLAGNIMCSSDVLANLPQAFGAICLNATGMDAFLNSKTLESYFEVFESPSHVWAFVSEPTLAENVGHAFDELVRHHPRLKSAVIYHVILTVARVDFRCRHILDSERGAKLVGETASETSDGKRPESEDTVMGDNADGSTQAALPSATSNNVNSKDPDALAYIGSLCKFLVTFFANHNMASAFVEQGGLPFLLDLSSLPTIVHDSIRLHHYNAMYSFSKAVHACVETKPHITLPVVLRYTSDVLDQTRALQDGHGSGSYFAEIIEGGSTRIEEGTRVIKALVRLEILTNLLYEIFSLSPPSRDRSHNLITTVNLTDMYVETIRRMGLVSRFCAWELVLLISEMSDDVNSKTSAWLEGYGEEASRVMSIRHAEALRLANSSNGTSGSASSALEAESDELLNNNAASERSRDPSTVSTTRVQNLTVIRHVLKSIPGTVSALFHNIGEKLVSRRRSDSYQRQNAFMVAETLADAAVMHLKYDPVELADQAKKNAFWAVTIEHIKTMFNLEIGYDPTALHSCVVIVLPAFRNRGGLAALLDILSQSLKSATVAGLEDEEANSAEAPSLTSDATAIIDHVLMAVECLTSSKIIAESQQSQIMQNSASDPARPLTYNPAQFLVELRHQILPVIEEVWNAKGSEKLDSLSRKKIIRILRTILEADHEHGAARKGDDVNDPRPVVYNAFKISEDRLKHLKDMDHDEDLALEALYRCLNDRERATDYCEIRKSLPLPRFSIPTYDQRREANPTPSQLAASQRRDSQATIPDPDLVERTQGGTETSVEQPASLPSNSSANAAESDADDGRMAMSIDNLLNLSESEQISATGATAGSLQRTTGPATVRPSTIPAAPPIQFVLNHEKVGIEELESRRAPLRKELILRVMDMLAVEDDKLTFDLAELLTTAASKSPTSQAMKETRAEFGETLIQALVSFNIGADLKRQEGNISAIANLLAILLQERDFYEACVDNIKQFIDPLLEFIKVVPSPSQTTSYPWIGHILLIFERLLSEELQPAQIIWTPPTNEESSEISEEPIANFGDPIFTDEQRDKLFESLVPLFPHVGKDKSLALSIVRVLVMLTRGRSIANKLAAKANLQRLFLMFKQLAGLTTDKLQSAFMLVLRQISEDDDTIKNTMRNAIIVAFKNARSTANYDTTSFVRQNYGLVLRAPRLFLEVVNETLKLRSFDAEQRPQVLVLRPDVEPELFSPWDPPNVVGPEKQADGEPKSAVSIGDVIPTTETVESPEMQEKAKQVVKPPVVEHPGGLIHFLLSQLLLYKDTDDQDVSSARVQKTEGNEATNDVEMEAYENTSDDEPTAPHASTSIRANAAPKPEEAKKDRYKAEDHPIYQYRCFILQCLTELLMSYNRAKVEFINFSRKADPKAMTPSKPKSGVLNYLLSSLIPVDHLERSTTIAALKKQGTSVWAASVVTALCIRTPETLNEPNNFGPDKEARDSDLLFVRKFVIEHAIKAFRDIQTSVDITPEVKYARLLAMSDLFNRILMGRTSSLHISSQRQPGENIKPAETEIARILFEKNLISVLTSSLSEIDLTVPFAKRAVKYILRPLKTLTYTAVAFSQNSDLSTIPGQTTEDDDISTATSVSDVSDEREETPDLFRHSALGMLESGHGHDDDDTDSESADEDVEMYDEGDYDDGMEYEEDIDQVDDDEAVSDPDDEDMGSDGGMENMPGDLPLNMEVVIEGDDELSGDDEDDESDEDEDDDDEGDDDDIEILDQLDSQDDDQSGDDNEDDWEDEIDETGDPIDGDHPDDIDEMGAEAIAEEFADHLTRTHAFGGPEGQPGTGAGGFRALEEDIANGTYMNDLRLVRDEEEDDDNYGDEDDDGDDPDEDDGEGDFMYEMHGDDEDEPFDMMDEAFGFLGGTRHNSHFMHPRFGRSDMLVTPDGHGSMFRTIRTHNRGAPDRHGVDDGVNPLLQRNADQDNLQHHRSTGPRRQLELLTGNGGLDFLRLLRGGADVHPGSLLHDMFNALHPAAPLTGHTWTTVRPEELDVLFGSQRARHELSTRDQRHGQDDISQPPPFTPVSTVARWQEASRLLFGTGHAEKVNKVINSILKLLVPRAMQEQRRLREEEERIAEERRIEEEKRRQEEEEKLAKEEEERQEREREEQRQREEAESARQAAEAEASTEAQDNEAMEGVETDEAEAAESTAEETIPAPSQEQPRVMTNIRGRQVDITDLGIDLEYLDALPEDLREEVLMGAVAERRSQPQNTTAVEAPSNVDPAFLDALPEDLRQEIIQQEEQQRRRRERQEQRRREQQASGAPAAEDMDTGSFLASLEPGLRRQVLMEQVLSNEDVDQLPEGLRQEARQALQEAEARHRDLGRRFGIPDVLSRPGASFNRDDATRRTQRRQIVQMLDKSGIATVLRLLFIPQQGSLKESLTSILQNLAQNRQSRGELISLLLTILQDGSADANAVERSFASLSSRAKHLPGQLQTPRALKRSTTGSLTTPLSPDMTPLMVIQQCLSALVGLVQHNGHAQTFFLNPHETPSTLKNKGKQKGKAKDGLAQKYALNALLSLLDRKMIMDNQACMEQLSTLLIRVTQPLNLLRRQERSDEPKESSEHQEESAAQPSVDPATVSNDQVEEGQERTTPDQQAEGSTTEAGQSSQKKDDKKEDASKKPKMPSPPVVPEQNLQLVINILTAKECNSKTFRDTLATINNLSAIPDAKETFGRELIKRVQTLADAIAGDLSELLGQLSTETGATVQSAALSKFTPSSSDQSKLLRVLMALDYLFASKSTDRPEQGTAAQNTDSSQAKNTFLSSLYESPTFSPAWSRLSECLTTIQDKDNMMNVATILCPLIEALMVVCKGMTLKDKGASLTRSHQFSVSSPEPESSLDTMFFRFTGDHRKILNELVRNNPRLMSGTFSLLVKNPKVLEFDNKRNYFSRRMHTRDEHRRSHPPLSFTVRRDQIFVDSYQKLFFKKPEEVKYGKLNVKFGGEDGVDAGGVTREWFQALTRQFFNPDYALFVAVAADRTTFHPSKLSWVNTEHLHYFKFIGRIIGKALYENRPLDCHFSRAVYKRILGRQVSIKDMESLDLEHYRSLVWTLENDIADVLTESFSVEHEAFGETQTVDLIPDGRNIAVTDENKHEWVQKLVEYKLTGSVSDQLEAFLQGFHEIVPASLVSIFNEQELELLISGLPEIDIEDWKANTDYQNYSSTSAQIQWFWRAVRSFDKEERAKLLQFVTGTSKVPLNGFKELEGMNGFSKFNVHRDYGDKDRLPSSHTCFNQLDLPEYDDYETLRSRLYTAMTAGGEYFGFA